jgi:hypothetical protein
MTSPPDVSLCGVVRIALSRPRTGMLSNMAGRKRLVQCCLFGTTTSSLALRATAKGGCGLDLAEPTRPLALSV